MQALPIIYVAQHSRDSSQYSSTTQLQSSVLRQDRRCRKAKRCQLWRRVANALARRRLAGRICQASGKGTVGVPIYGSSEHALLVIHVQHFSIQ